MKFGSESGKALELREATTHARSGVCWKAEGADQRVEVPDGGCRELDTSHELQLVQRDRFAAGCLAESELRALVSAVDLVQ